jgi:hypothetical protein
MSTVMEQAQHVITDHQHHTHDFVTIKGNDYTFAIFAVRDELVRQIKSNKNYYLYLADVFENGVTPSEIKRAKQKYRDGSYERGEYEK